jgi:protein-S-isoprenylcysteine O-methyltransferase Ste14
MNDLLAVITIMFWTVIPLFWIPVHLFSISFRRLGLKAYLLPAFTWLPLIFFIYKNRHLLLDYKIGIPFLLSVTGWALLIVGTLLHIWTASLLSLWGIIGGPEVSGNVQGNLITRGPFSIVRHPTYLAHTLLFSGVFLITGVVSVAMVTIVDFIIVNALIIPLEEKELSNRFGERFTIYKKKVPCRFFPWIF